MSKLSAIVIFGAALALVGPALADDRDDPPKSRTAFADTLVEFAVGSPGPKKGGFDPAYALGAPDGQDATTLGCGGTLVVQFSSGGAADRDGPDFRVYEIGPDVEPYSVDISSDGAVWYDLGTAKGTGEFDISGAAPEGRAYAFLRITDLRNKCGGGYAGADIDAVEVLNSVAVPELAGIEIVESETLEPLDEIAVGESFRIRLTYAEDPGTTVTESVTIKTSLGVAQLLEVTGDSRSIVSEPVLVLPAVEP